jgi:hypothetical protein
MDEVSIGWYILFTLLAIIIGEVAYWYNIKKNYRFIEKVVLKSTGLLFGVVISAIFTITSYYLSGLIKLAILKITPEMIAATILICLAITGIFVWTWINTLFEKMFFARKKLTAKKEDVKMTRK